LRRKQAHDGQRSDRFAGTGFADEAENFAGIDGEVEVANGWEDICGDSCPRLSSPKDSLEVDI
jgi:hypothetical protein